jgi:hypothetical protein
VYAREAGLHRMLIRMVLVSHMYPPPIRMELVFWPRVFLVQTYN